MTIHEFVIPGSNEKPISIDLLSDDLQKPNPLVIFVHGFKGFKDWGTHHLIGKRFVKNGFNFLKFNFSHNGIGSNQGDVFDDLEGFSENTFSKELFDLNGLINFTQSGEKFLRPSQLYLIGHSLGGGISLIQTKNDLRIDKLATWASISNFRDLWSPETEKNWQKEGVSYFSNSRTKQQMPISSNLLSDLKENEARFDILSAATTIKQPVLVVHGTSDPVVSHESAVKLSAQQEKNQLLLVPETDHVFGAGHPWNRLDLPVSLERVCDETIRFFQG